MFLLSMLSVLFGPDTGSAGLLSHSIPSTKVVYPDTSQMVIYDPSQKLGTYKTPDFYPTS